MPVPCPRPSLGCPAALQGHPGELTAAEGPREPRVHQRLGHRVSSAPRLRAAQAVCFFGEFHGPPRADADSSIHELPCPPNGTMGGTAWRMHDVPPPLPSCCCRCWWLGWWCAEWRTCECRRWRPWWRTLLRSTSQGTPRGSPAAPPGRQRGAAAASAPGTMRVAHACLHPCLAPPTSLPWVPPRPQPLLDPWLGARCYLSEVLLLRPSPPTALGLPRQGRISRESLQSMLTAQAWQGAAPKGARHCMGALQQWLGNGSRGLVPGITAGERGNG